MTHRKLSPNTAFTNADVALRFCFGYWCAWVRTLRGTVLANHFANLSDYPPTAAAVNLVAESGVLFMPFHPAGTRLPIVELGPQTIRYVPSQYRLHYIDIRGSFSEYLRKFSSKSRHELRRTVRRFIRSCADSTYFREYRSASEMADFYELASNVSKRTVLGRWGGGIPGTPQFYSELVHSAEEGNVRGFLLFHLDRPVAFDLCRVRGNCLTGDLRGYDPEFRRFSPGRVLTFCILNRLFDEGSVEKWDFGPGEADYKAFFSTAKISCADVYYFRRNIRNACLIVAHCAIHAAWKVVGKILKLTHLRDLVRMLIRNCH